MSAWRQRPDAAPPGVRAPREEVPVSVSSELCYECGSAIPDGLGESALACLGVLPGGAEHWVEVEVCPECARESARQRRLGLLLVFVLVALLTFAVAFPLLP
jgi:hypothetical protein